MPNQFNPQKIILFSIISLIFIMSFSLLSASETPSVEQIKKAIKLRNQALVMQNEGNYFEAMKVFAEAINLYPQYAQAYCDMGILYEAFGIKKDAEIIYLKALEIDPGCLNGYTNLALLYESTQNFSKAAYYWKKRAELGSPNDKWTQKAKEKLTALSQSPPEFNIEGKVKKEVADNSKMIKNEVKKKKEINALKNDLISRDKELNLRKQEFKTLKQEIAALRDKKDQELFAINQELNQLKQQIDSLRQENEEEISAKNEKIKLLKENILYVKQQSKKKVTDKQKEVAKAAQQLTDLIGSLEEDVSIWKNKNSPP